MAVTRSWAAPGARPAVVAIPPPRARRIEWYWLAAASFFVAGGLAMVYAARTLEFGAVEQKLAHGGLIDLNTVQSADGLLPVLQSREDTAPAVFAAIERNRPLRNTGVLARVLPLSKLKPLLIVRTPREFRLEFVSWAALYFAGFYLAAFAWRLTRFPGDRAFLPALHLLTGIGFALMLSLRDPLRDTLEFQKFALGVFLGCLLLILPALKPFHYLRLSDWCYTPLFLAIGLFGLLLKFGRGPAGNDAKVNLGPFQPVELIKILLVLFLAGYFTRHWERLRDLREKRVLPKLFRRIGLPRAEHLAPVGIATAGALLLFFVLKDMGPALVTLFVFLAMFATARGRPGLAMAGIVLMTAAVFAGYRMGQPKTVVQRIDMWLSPWDNNVHGGDQLAHALWAFSTGGAWGSGPGWGDPGMIPAGNTDLVLPAIGEEWGFVGVVMVLLLAGFLVTRGLRVAQRAETHFGFFLALGLSSLIAFEMLLISSGVLGVLPLSGVVSPFLSSGNTAMLANFLIFALLISISAEGEGEVRPLLNTRPLRWVLAAAACVLVASAARYQVLKDRDYLARDAHSFEQDGVKRPQHNPRMNSLAHEIPRGTIYDRTGVPLATADWSELDRHAAEYQALGVDIEKACSRFDNRHYPFGSAAAHLIGDIRTGENFHATNASLVEHDSNRKLQGYDYPELASLVRYRHQPGNPGIARLLARDRSVHLTVDIRLQLRARDILEKHLEEAGVRNGSVVVLDAATGGVLAMVSAPAPDPHDPHTPDELLDRARYGEYPPGSTFKLVTAIAALRRDPELKHRTFLCRRLPDGRAGNVIPGWNRAIKDDIGDSAHGTLDMSQAITVSCNAYFAQLGVHDVGSLALAETAAEFGISTGDPKQLRKDLPFASYGQGAVLVSPFKMARVAAAIAADGRMPEGRWIADDSNPRSDPPVDVLPPEQAQFLAAAMRRVVLEGTARHVMAGTAVSMAGKTGTAQLDAGMPHAWFTGFAPYDGGSPRLAFAVLAEHGGYGGRTAAPIAREVMEAAHELGILQ
ncbi:MAG TPA: FtsW/RodA/SpoVE family cell cycle protein [Bryobacteraceae bacterium]|jgi:cell division protein FtsI/penicillin-binding protein 2/cell division protein FtsW (lipid II flippase)|nr:FtsW/RodA/SpoVE family cell cycle protein [Bryobacteraceae bacterium]